MNKEGIEIELSEDVDPWKIAEYLKRVKGVTKAYVVTMQVIRVYYLPNHIVGKRLVKLVGSYGNGGQRKRNIVHLRSLDDSQPNKAA